MKKAASRIPVRFRCFQAVKVGSLGFWRKKARPCPDDFDPDDLFVFMPPMTYSTAMNFIHIQGANYANLIKNYRQRHYKITK